MSMGACRIFSRGGASRNLESDITSLAHYVTVLQSHLESAPSNAKYASHRIQNELISICEDELLSNIILDVNKSIGFSILADETADISGIEQLSVGVWFVHMTLESTVLRE